MATVAIAKKVVVLRDEVIAALERFMDSITDEDIANAQNPLEPFIGATSVFHHVTGMIAEHGDLPPDAVARGLHSVLKRSFPEHEVPEGYDVPDAIKEMARERAMELHRQITSDQLH